MSVDCGRAERAPSEQGERPLLVGLNPAWPGFKRSVPQM